MAEHQTEHQKNVLLIAAAGRGRRLGAGKNKIYLPLKGKPVLAYTLEVFLKTDLFSLAGVIIAPGEEDIFWNEVYTPYFAGDRRIFAVEGGSERQVSVFNGLKALQQKKIPENSIVCIHDGARPLVQESLIREVCREALSNGAAITCVPLKDTIKEIERGLVVRTPPREQYMAVQTPQCFKFSVLWQAHEKAAKENYTGSDDSTLVEHLGVQVMVVPGSYENFKITTPFDLRIAEGYLTYQAKEASSMNIRVGMGYDVHPLKKGLPLILGGVKIPFSSGLAGYSDADVLLHAIIDALLGAAALGDIGTLFPSGDQRYKDISSLVLLKEAAARLRQAGFEINNLDSVIVAQRPRLAPYTGEMRQNIAQTLNIENELISVKATTTEALGFVGREEGIASYAIAGVRLA